MPKKVELHSLTMNFNNEHNVRGMEAKEKGEEKDKWSIGIWIAQCLVLTASQQTAEDCLFTEYFT